MNELRINSVRDPTWRAERILVTSFSARVWEQLSPRDCRTIEIRSRDFSRDRREREAATDVSAGDFFYASDDERYR